MLSFILGLFLIFTPAKEDTLVTWVNNDTTSTFILDFNESMDTTGLRNKSNYSVVDNTGKIWQIYKVGIVVSELDNGVSYHSSVALITRRIDYKRTYTITVKGVKDISNNFIQSNNTYKYYYSGLSPTFSKPNTSIKK